MRKGARPPFSVHVGCLGVHDQHLCVCLHVGPGQQDEQDDCEVPIRRPTGRQGCRAAPAMSYG